VATSELAECANDRIRLAARKNVRTCARAQWLTLERKIRIDRHVVILKADEHVVFVPPGRRHPDVGEA
jgi:hypothetical protein